MYDTGQRIYMYVGTRIKMASPRAHLGLVASEEAQVFGSLHHHVSILEGRPMDHLQGGEGVRV